MNNVAQFPKIIDGLSAADRRSIAFHEWMESQPNGVSTMDMKAELARLRAIIPDESEVV